MAKNVKLIRSEYELKKLSDFWLDLSKLVLASFVLKLIEPSGFPISLGSLVTFTMGLTFFFACAKLGLDFARKVKEL